jgi:gamma-glutamyl-gamma-aminobutyrate hydrolase PuuD
VRPLIGIPPVRDDRGRLRPGRATLYLDERYAAALDAAGAAPVCLPLQRDAAALVDRLHGLLIPGGGDFAPERSYPAGVDFDAASPEQLDFDRRLLARALERGIPVLGICYGMQLLAVHHGGSLHYDIPTDLPDAGAHRLPEPEGRHALRIEPRSRLAEILAGDGASVNSRHHQAVAEAGPGLLVCARADDGVVEAVERPGGAFCLGVQWHPERMEAGHRQRVFGAFVRACAGG